MKLKNKICLVTGGLSGIGLATARVLAGEGATVIAADLAASVAANEPPAGIHALPVDIADETSVKILIDEVVARFGRIDAVVNSAGIGRDIPFLDTPVEIFDRIMAINLRGTFLIGREAARHMVAQHAADGRVGRIVNIASISGQRGGVGRAAYGASKAGVINLSQVMAVELSAKGVLVNVIAPGPIETPLVKDIHTPEVRAAYMRQVPIRRYGLPEEIGRAAVFLIGEDAAYITGHVLNVDGGFMAGGLMDGR